MATAILANFRDVDTAVLNKIWAGIPEINVIEITDETPDARRTVCQAMKDENDLIIFAGHGSKAGLFSPVTPVSLDCLSDLMLVDPYNKQLIKAKKVVGIWCFAADFAKRVNLHGFFSNMFISNPAEASYCGIKASDAQSITNSEIKFCEDLNLLIKNNVPMDQWKDILISKANMEDPVVKFNYDGLYFSKQ